jgi:predicted metal-dependent hydrolase
MHKSESLETNYTIDYRDIKYPRLEFKTGSLQLILPKNYKNHDQLLEKHKKWIRQKQQTIQNALHQAKTTHLNEERAIPQLRTLIKKIIEKYETELSTEINKIFYRKMKTKWASYSQKGNLTANTLMKYLPDTLVEYVIFHEMTHSKQKRHNEKFWKIITRKFKNHQQIEEQLLAYWFIIQKTIVEQ